jgi:hypothetical protein
MGFLTSGFSMLSVILPVRAEHNCFWNSSVGLACINSFMDKFSQLSDVDRFVVVTRNDKVGQMAKKRGMTVSEAVIPGNPDRPYTFDQVRSLARDILYLSTNQTDGLVIADHRNLLLTAEDISRAHKAYHQNPVSGVISLVTGYDYPCQFKSYYNFIDLVISRFESGDHDSDMPSTYKGDNDGALNVRPDGPGKITTEVSASDSRCRISFHIRDLQLIPCLAQIIPFDPYGPLYSKSKEILVETPQQDMFLNIGTRIAKGIIFIFATPAQSGEYDSMEFFVPENAPWEVGESLSTVYSKISHEPIYDRRQFPPVYTYDGSLCILNRKHLTERAKSNLFLLKLEESCIVTDWVDYWFTVASHHTTTALEL